MPPANVFLAPPALGGAFITISHQPKGLIRMANSLVFSEERTKELRSRSKRCVCKYCGSRLQVRLINFGQIATANLEIFCTNCGLIEYGTEPEIYQSAVYLVDHLGFNAYPDRSDNGTRRQLNIGKVCEIIAWHERQVGLLSQDGYCVPLTQDPALLDGADGSIIILGERLEEE